MTAPILLYDSATGDLIARVDAGEGLRQKSWLEEIPIWLHDAVQPPELGKRGIGALANFPNHLDEADFFFLTKNTARLGLGDGTVAVFGAVAPTIADPEAANYGKVGDTGEAVPRGSTSQARVTAANAAAYDLSATGNDVLTITVNGVKQTVTIVGGTMTAVTAEEVKDSINTSGIDGAYAVVVTAGNVRVLSKQRGRHITLKVETTGAGTPIFGAAAGVAVTGEGGPLGTTRNTSGQGFKPQRGIVRKSVAIKATLGGEAVTVTDDGAGALAGENAAGTVTATGTVNYATGAVSLTYTGDAPDAATAVNVEYKTLDPIPLHEPVRIAPGDTPLEVAMTVK